MKLSAAAKDLVCENFELSTWINHGDIKNIKTCFMKTSTLTIIKTPGSSIASPRDESVEGINLSGNRNVRFLPENVVEKFPNLISYDARFSSIEFISKTNFKDLSKLVKVYLETNLIKSIGDNTFEDLTELQYLSLSMTLNNLHLWNKKVLSFLDDNRIQEMNGVIFNKNPKLSHVYLHGNDCIDEDFVDNKITALSQTLNEKCKFDFSSETLSLVPA